MTERHTYTIFREPCLGCDICQARALSMLSRPNNENLLVVAGYIVYKKLPKYAKIWPPIHFLHPIQQIGIFESPLYKKHLLDPLYKILTFSRTTIQKNSIFETPYIKNWYFQDLHIQQNGISEPYYTKKWHFRDRLYNKTAFSRPLYKTLTFTRSPYKTKWPFRDPF